MLWRGMLPALYRHAVYTGIRMSVYEEVRSSLQRENKVHILSILYKKEVVLSLLQV